MSFPCRLCADLSGYKELVLRGCVDNVDYFLLVYKSKKIYRVFSLSLYRDIFSDIRQGIGKKRDGVLKPRLHLSLGLPLEGEVGVGLGRSRCRCLGRLRCRRTLSTWLRFPSIYLEVVLATLGLL